jgi:glycyl-tRNA synthetase beta chain
MPDFLLEVGTEEIPAGMIAGLAGDLVARVTEGLAAHGLAMTGRRIIAAPRRIGFELTGLPARQADRNETVVGPAVAIARDAQGTWTKAAEGFAKKQGIALSELGEVQGPKGTCVGFHRDVKGRGTAEILAEVVPAAVDALHLPKAMKWGTGDFLFVRPVRWVVAMLDGEVVPMAVKGVTSGRISRGRRTFGAQSVEIPSVADYFPLLERQFVRADPEERFETIRSELDAQAASLGGHVPPDPELVEKLVYLCEGPSVLAGTIDPEFLSLPAQILVTCLREHQSFFVVLGADGRALPHFLAVMDAPADPKGLVRRGLENVSRSRLADARFFYEHDKAVPLERRLEDLKGIVYHPKLGTYRDKALRIRDYARELAPLFGADPELAGRAAELCKCDLGSLLVQEKEFTALQGIAGGLYAKAQGEDPAVARAISEHYDASASPSGLSQCVCLADKLDALMEFFRIGQAPTGSKDPFALRRAATVAVSILCSPVGPGRVDLESLLNRWAPGQGSALLAFMGERARYKWESEGYAYDEVNAVLATGLHDLSNMQDRLSALHEVRNEAGEDFDHLSIAFKRVRNILKGLSRQALRPELFKPVKDKEGSAERALHGAYEALERRVSGLLDSASFGVALRQLATLRPAVDRFFDDVLVMCDPDGKDPAKTALQQNRLALLQRVVGLFNRVADLSEIVPKGGSEG